MITIIGGIPEPLGGVTNFSYRLASHLKGKIDAIIDLYPSANKRGIVGVKCLVRPTFPLVAVVWFIAEVARSTSNILYFNFSTARSLFFFLFLPKKKGTTWVLTLHHGDLSAALPNFPFVRELISWQLGRFDCVAFIGQQQKSFFQQMGVCDSILKRIIPYLPYVPLGSPVDSADELLNKLHNFKQRYKKIVVSSGYPTKLYRHDVVLNYFAEHGDAHDAGLVLCLYGDDHEQLRSLYKEQALRNPRVLLFEGLSPDLFQVVLQHSDIYVRPSERDSFGVAVAEALECGLVVIASDVCERPKRAYLFPANNLEKFKVLLTAAIHDELETPQGDEENGLEVLEKLLT